MNIKYYLFSNLLNNTGVLFRCRVTGENVDLSQCGQGADKEGEEKPAGVSDETMQRRITL